MESAKSITVKVIVGVLLSGSLLALPACGQNQQSSSSSSSEASAQQPTLQQVGASSTTSKSFTIKNAIGKDISGFIVGAAGTLDGATATSILPAWKSGDDAQVNYEPAAGTAAYDMLVVCNDGSSYMLHNVDVSVLADNAQLKAEGTMAYVSYTADGKTIDTLAAEQARAQEVAAAAQAEQERIAAEQAQSEQELAAVESYSDSNADTNNYDSGYSSGGDSDYSAGGDYANSYDSGASADNSAGVAQSGDGCVSGGVVLR